MKLPLLEATPAVQEFEQQSKTMCEHVLNAHAMQEYTHEHLQQSCNDAINGTACSDISYTFVIDFMMNMQVPWFGGEQPSETYHFSAKAIYLLGMVEEFSHHDKHKKVNSSHVHMKKRQVKRVATM